MKIITTIENDTKSNESHKEIQIELQPEELKDIIKEYFNKQYNVVDVNFNLDIKREYYAISPFDNDYTETPYIEKITICAKDKNLPSVFKESV